MNIFAPLLQVCPVNVKEEELKQNGENECQQPSSTVDVKSEVADHGMEKSLTLQNPEVKTRAYDEATLLIKPEYEKKCRHFYSYSYVKCPSGF
jgi:hypothetical protein